MPRPLIIVGASTRAAAQSAIRADYKPWCIDLFADRDLKAIATCVQCPAGEYPVGMVKRVDQDAPPGDVSVLFVGAMENHTQVVDAIAMGRKNLSSSGESMRKVRDPLVLPGLPEFEGIGRPRTIATHAGIRKAFRIALAMWSRRQWLIKSRRGAGGSGIRFASLKDAVGDDQYLQQYIKGDPVGACFVTNGWSVKLLGATRQLIGVEQFAAPPFAYCGSIGPIDLAEAQRDALTHLGVSLAQRFDLRGVFGVDLILDRDGVLWPIEVNPRYCASVEVIERATGVSALSDWPIDMRPTAVSNTRRHVGKAYLFAKADCVAPDLYDTLTDEQIADVPDIGRKIRKGRPVCTILAKGDSDDACLERLHDLARKVYTCL